MEFFNIDNKKYFLSSKSALDRFLKDHVTLKTGVMMLKINLSIRNIFFKYIQIEKSYFELK